MTRNVCTLVGSLAATFAVALTAAVIGSPPEVHAQIERSSAQAGTAVASDVYKVAYFDLNSCTSEDTDDETDTEEADPAGGDGNGLVRTINPTSTPQLCEMTYVFDAHEEEQECCGCVVTNDGLRVQTVFPDLSCNPSDGQSFGTGVIKIISSLPNAPAPEYCDPALALSLAPALRPSITHTEESNGVYGVSVQNFQDAPLDATELANLVNTCAFIKTNQSGAGICNCGVGDWAPATASARR